MTSFFDFSAKSLEFSAFYLGSFPVSETCTTSFLSHQAWFLVTCPTGFPSFFF